VWADALPNLLIGLREGLEAGLVVSILLAAAGKPSPRKTAGASAPIWLGVAAAVILALSFGAVLTFYRSVLSSSGQEALGGTLSVIAVCLVTWMIFWMRRTARGLAKELREQVDTALTVSTAALAVTAFLAVGREGLETSLFLWTAAQASGQTAAPLAGAAIGITIAVALCAGLYRRAVKIRLDLFFNRTAILLIVIAGGVLAYGLGDLQDAGWLPGHLWIAFDLSGHIDASSWWMSIITGVTELSPKMTWLQVVAYVCYLAVVLTLFIRARSAPAATHEPEPAHEPDPEPTPASPRWSRRTVATGTCAALLAPPAIAAAIIGLAPRLATTAQTIDVTASSCASGWSTGTTGAQTFTVENTSTDAAEVNLIQTTSQGIVAEIETLGPGTKQTLTATLTAGTYAWRCLISGKPTTESAAVTVTGLSTSGGVPTGTIAAAVKPVSVAELERPFRKYTAYVNGKLSALNGQIAQIQRDLERNDLAAARRDWVPADLTWQEVGEEPYGSFGDYGVKIDSGPQRFAQGMTDPQWTGLHRLEYGLWHGQSVATLRKVTNQLSSDVTALRAKLSQLNIDPTDLPVRAHEVLEDALRDQLAGATDEGAGDTYREVLADVSVTRVVLGDLAPLLDERSPHLLTTAYAQLDTLAAALKATGWTPIDSTPLAQRQAVNAAAGAVLETLSLVPDLLEVPAH
jgi:high-affinity iron transporter